MLRSAILAILAAVLVLAPVAVFADDAVQADAKKPADFIKLTGVEQVKLGEKQVLKLEVTPPADVIGFNCRVSYDPDAIKIGKITKTDAEELGGALILPKDTGGFIDLTAAMPGQKWTYAGEVFIIEYTPMLKGKTGFEFLIEKATEENPKPYKPGWSGMDGRTMIDVTTLTGLKITVK